MIGAGGQAGQGDAANLLKPALARGELRTIAATTWLEYKKYFEGDPALKRRFQVVKIDEPDPGKAIRMMRSFAALTHVDPGFRASNVVTADLVLAKERYPDAPQMVQFYRKSLDEIRAARKSREQLLEELAEFRAKQLLAEAEPKHGRKLIVQTFPDRDMAFLKLLAQKLTRLDSAAVALLASTSAQPSLVFAQSPGQPFDMGALMKDAMSRLGGRGGGSKDLAQGGALQADTIPTVLSELAAKLVS